MPAGSGGCICHLATWVQRVSARAAEDAVDWGSRYHPQPFHQRHAPGSVRVTADGSAATAEPGRSASPLSIWAPTFIPDTPSIAQTHRDFDDDDQIRDEELRRRRVLRDNPRLMDLVEASKHYPCVRPPGWSTSAHALNPQSTAYTRRKTQPERRPHVACNPDLTTIRPPSAGWLAPRKRAIRLSYAEDDRWTQVGFGGSGGGRVVHPNGSARTSQACASYGTSQG
jgi:hypothetical protein